MMKRILLCLLVIVVLVVCSILWERHIDGHISDMMQELEAAIDRLGKDDAASAGCHLQIASNQWMHLAATWYFLADHMHLQDISALIARAKRHVQSHSAESAIVEVESAMIKLTNWRESYRFTLANIL